MTTSHLTDAELLRKVTAEFDSITSTELERDLAQRLTKYVEAHEAADLDVDVLNYYRDEIRIISMHDIEDADHLDRALRVGLAAIEMEDQIKELSALFNS